jgi:arylsulfatase A-like enzyme
VALPVVSLLAVALLVATPADDGTSVSGLPRGTTSSSPPASPAATPAWHRPSQPTRPDGGAGRPDVVVVLTDDQRTDTLPLMPQVQRLLAEKGTTFVAAQVPTPLCCPSRASILTGRYAHGTGVWSNGRPDGGWWVFHELGLEERTVAVALQQAGYRTGLVGKYFNAFAKWSPEGFTPPGWDTFLAFRTPVKSGGYYNYALSDGRTRGTTEADYSTDVLARAAEHFIRGTPEGQPLFLYFAPYAPHAPSRPAPRHRGAWAGRLPDLASPTVADDVRGKPAWVRRQRAPARRSLAVARIRQQESLMAVDDAVGRLVDALDDTGRLTNTLVVYLSDHGLLLGEHHLVGKGAPYAPALSVPMVLRWDGTVASGRVDQRLALNLDVTATIAAAAAVPFDTDGLSLLGPARRSGFVVEGAPDSKVGRPAYCGWRTADWTYVRWATGEEELYSQGTDPGQVRNLAVDGSRHPRLRPLREHTRRECRPAPPGFDW